GIVDLHAQPLVRIERREIVEIDLVPDRLGILEIDRVDLQKREIAFPLLGRTDLSLHSIAGAKRKSPYLRRTYVDVVRSGQVIGLRRTQETEPVRQHL